MSQITDLTLWQAANALRKKNISVTEITLACLKRIEECEPKIEALLSIDPENALKLAKQYDQSGPEPEKPLWGVPITLKDALSTIDFPTTAGSRILENFKPIYDAFVVEKLRKAGAIILAKNNMDEFAMGSATENSAFKKTRNPWDLNKIPGGSSGGSAASVAVGECFASLGSDTGGSIRQPAAFCGCVGLKPTYGRVSRYGLFAFASSLDQIGPLARSVKDCAIMLKIIAGYDPRDNTCSKKSVPDYPAELEEKSANSVNNLSLKGVKIGFAEEFFGTGIDDEVKEACELGRKTLQDLGAQILPVKLPDPQIASATYYIIAMAEASSNLARYDGIRYGRRAGGVNELLDLYVESRTQGFGNEVKRRIMLGSYVLSAGYYDAYFRKAAQTRRIIFDDYKRALSRCDALYLPVAPVTAWPIGLHEQDPLQAYLMDAFTLPINLAGLPAISLPISLGQKTGMPVGAQLVGDAFAEGKILKIAHILENALPKLPKPQMMWKEQVL